MYEKEINDAPYIDNGHCPEKQTVITVDVIEHPHTALLLHSFFSSHKELIPEGIELQFPDMNNIDQF